MPRRNRLRRHRLVTYRSSPAYARRYAILRRHARLLDQHRLAHCVPTETEIQRGFASLGRPGKVIYDTRVRALNAAAELRRLDQRRWVPYRCPRGDDEHWHLQSYHHSLGQ